MGREEARMKVLVTGGSGFLGSALARRLAADGFQVTTISRRLPEFSDHERITSIRGDITRPETLPAEPDGFEAVFHTAAKAGVWGPKNEYRAANVCGTENIIKFCLRHGISKLIFTGSPSSVFQPGDNEGLDETVPYPERYLCDYPQTKAEAERLVLTANSGELATISLRPHLIWGPGDRHLVPRILRRGKAGRLRRIGTGNALIDTIYIDNAVEGHMAAFRHLLPGGKAAGKAYFLSDGTPVPMWDMINRILHAGGLPPVEKTISLKSARFIASASEWIYRSLGIKQEPLLTRFVVNELTTAHWFDISAARRDLGYAPRVTLDEGFRRLEAWLKKEGLRLYGLD